MSKKTRFDIVAELQELEDKQNKLRYELEQIPELSEEFEVAEFLHKKFCKHNHTDGCGWHYKTWEDTPLEFSRKEYLARAKLLLEFVDADSIAQIVNILSSPITIERQNEIVNN